MASEEEERPRFVTGGYGRHRRQWVKVTKYTNENPTLLKMNGRGKITTNNELTNLALPDKRNKNDKFTRRSNCLFNAGIVEFIYHYN